MVFKNNDFRKICLLIFVAFTVFAGQLNGQTQKPNIIIILGDDLHYSYLAHTGHMNYSTPNLDTMAQRGMSFTQCHSSPLCSPSRHMLLTGKANFRNYKRWAFLDTTAYTMANMMQQAGYNTAVYGKWQLNGGDTAMHKWGFNTYSLHDAMSSVNGEGGGGRKYKNPLIYEKGAFLPDSLTAGKYSEDIFTDSVLNFIDSNKTTPFFIYYPMAVVHEPYQPTPDDSAYANWNDPITSDTSYYRKMVKYMDKKVGVILNKIQTSGLQNNTYVIFTTDNGTPRAIHDSIQRVVATINGDSAYIQDVQGQKGFTNAGATHVPLIVFGPNVQQGSVNNDLIDFTDFLPTIAGLSHTPAPTNYGTMDGVSFAGRITGNNPETPRKWLFQSYKPFYNAGSLKRWAQTDNYKLYDSLNNYIFYNVQDDMYEHSPLPDSVLTAYQLQEKRKLRIVLDNYATQGPPVLNNTIIKNITDTSASIGATITPVGGFTSVTARGTAYAKKILLWGLLENPVVDGYTDISTFAMNRTGLLPQTFYSGAAYATQNNLTAFSPIVNFYTLSKAVVQPPTQFKAYPGKDFIGLKWNDAVFPATDAYRGGYMILYSTSIPSIIDSPNGKGFASIITNGRMLPTGSAWLPLLPANNIVVSGLSPDSQYNFLLIPYTWDSKQNSTNNYLTAGAIIVSATPAPSIYTWNGGIKGSWDSAANWLPPKIPTNGDSVQFISHIPTVVTNIPNITLSKLVIKDSSNVTFQSTTWKTMNVSEPGSSNNFYIGINGSLTLDGSNSIILKVLSGSTARIDGNLIFRGGAHRFYSDDSLSVIFTNKGGCIAGDTTFTGFSGAPFGNSGAANVVVFENGASYTQYEGTSPFALPSPSSKVIFKSNSNFYYSIRGNIDINITGRTYGNLFIKRNTRVNAVGGDIVTMNSLVIRRGSSFSFTGSGANKLLVTGDIIAEDTASATLLSGTGGIYFIGTSAQNIGGGGGTGTITFNRMIIPAANKVNLLRNVTTTVLCNVSGELNCDTSVLSGPGTFNLLYLGTLGVGSINGINSIGNTGNIQTAVRGFNSGANYIFNAKGNQVTGTFATLPKANTVYTLKFSSTGKVTLLNNFTTTVIGIAPYTLLLLNGLVDLNGYNLTIPNNGTVNGAGGNFTGTNGTLVFAGIGSVTGTITFSNVLISKAVDFGTGSVIGNSLVVNTGGVVVNNSPVYGTKSSLIYNAGSIYRRNLEWSATAGKGYPYNVIIKGATTLDLSANGFADRAIAGNLSIGSDSSTGSLTMGVLPNKLMVKGNITIGGTNGSSKLILSNKAGGDLYIGGNWIRNINGLFTDYGRNITFMGEGEQIISGTNGETFSYLKIDKPAGGISLTSDLTITKNLTFLSTNNGLVATQTKTLSIANENPSSIVRLGNGYIIGNLKRAISTGANLVYKFTIGTLKGYTPATITFNSVTSSGNLSATSIDNDHPLLTPYISKNKSINRYWKLTGDSLQYNTYKAKFEFLASDKDSNVNTAYCMIGKYTDGAWSFPSVINKKPDYIEATDINGFGDFQIGQQGCATPAINASITHVACADSANASIFVTTSGGTTPLTFAWTGPNGFTSSVASITNLSAGKYVLTVTATGGCAVTKEFQVTQPSKLLVNANISSNITCHGGTTTLIVSASGGTGSYQYTLSNGSSITAPQSGNNFTVLAGNYTVAVSDSNGCSVTSSSITVTQPEALIAGVNAGAITCNAGTTTLTVSASGGTGSYQYTLSNGSSTTAPQSDSNFTVSAGTYSVTVVDANLCSFSTNPISINEPTSLQTSITIDPMNCPDTVTTIHISANGGTGTFTYNIYDGVNVSSFQNDNSFIVKSGSYTITVKDGNGCKKSSQITVNPCGLRKSINITQHTDFKIKVSPNPSASDFILNVQSNNDDPLRITVIDALGRIVGQFYGNATKNYSFGKNLNSGTYFLQVKQGKNIQQKTIIKKE